MKKVLLIFIFLLAITVANICSFAETKTIIAQGSLDVPNIWSFQYYFDDNVLYSTEVPFTNMDPTSSHVMADGREYYDGKNDVGILCRTNLNVMWHLKIHATPSDTPLVTLGNIQYYLGQPWNRTLERPADGEVIGGAAWHSIPTSSTAIYKAGSTDLSNLPYGTLCLFSFAINPGKLSPTEVYNCTIHYTLTTPA